MKTSVASRVDINAPVSQVFMYLTDLNYLHTWNPSVVEVSSKQQLKLGSTYETKSKMIGSVVEAKNKVSKFVKNKQFQIDNDRGIVHYCVNFELDEEDGQTVLCCSADVELDVSKFVFTELVLKTLVRREIESDLQSLKVAVEHKLT